MDVRQATGPNAECRKSCAFNFPAIVKTVGPANYATILHSTLENLASDELVAGSFQ